MRPVAVSTAAAATCLYLQFRLALVLLSVSHFLEKLLTGEFSSEYWTRSTGLLLNMAVARNFYRGSKTDNPLFVKTHAQNHDDHGWDVHCLITFNR